MTQQIVLLRHGVTQANEKWLYCGKTNLPLSQRGAEELREKRLQGGYPDVSGFAVYTSGMLRTEQTLELLFGEVPHTAQPGLREVSFGEFEMHSYEELKQRPDYQAWIMGDNEKNVPPGGESGEQMKARVFECFDRLLKDSKNILIVAHGGPVAALMARLFPGEARTRYEWQPRGGEGYEILLDNQQPVSWKKLPDR